MKLNLILEFARLVLVVRADALVIPDLKLHSHFWYKSTKVVIELPISVLQTSFRSGLGEIEILSWAEQRIFFRSIQIS